MSLRSGFDSCDVFRKGRSGDSATRGILFIRILFFSALLLPGPAFCSTEKEHILNFHTEIHVGTDAQITVTESITVNASGAEIQRGIFRVLPLSRVLDEKTVFNRYEIKSISRDGQPEKFKTKRDNGNLIVYVGKDDIYLTPGIHTYEIIYETNNQIGFFEDFDELYWNVTGNSWSFPISKVSATIHLPPGAKLIQESCYTGLAGSTETKCRISKTDSATITWHASNLLEGEGLTIAAGFTKNIVHLPELPSLLSDDNLSRMLISIIVLLAGLMLYLWNKFGKDHQSPTVVPHFDVPDNLSPAALGYIATGQYKNSLLAAALINMAVKGHLSIEEVKKRSLFGSRHFKLNKLNSRNQDLAPEERQLFDALFTSHRQSVILKDHYSSLIARVVREFTSGVKTRHLSLLGEGNNRLLTFALFLLLSVAYWGITVWAYQYLYDYNRLIIAGVLYTLVTVLIGRCILADNSKARWMWIPPFLLTAAGFYFLYLSDYGSDPFLIGYVFLGAGSGLLAVFNYFIRKPGEELLRIRSRISGFKMYMGAAENHLVQFHNPPQMTPEIFEKYLPYALVLGVGDVWGKKFEQLLKHNAIDYQHTWYSGKGSPGSFSGNLSNNLNRGLSKSLSSASSGNRSGGSGSGGRGSSGGGGGGGGGGGW